MSLPTGAPAPVSIQSQRGKAGMNRKRFQWVWLAIFVAACDLSSQEEGLNFLAQQYDFSNSTHGWEGDFADYPVEDSVAYELKFDHSSHPESLGAEKSLVLSGNNLGDNLFMFVKKKITHLKPVTDYTLSFEVEFASDVPKDSVAVGGSPGQTIYLKAGGSGEEPQKIEVYGYFRMNIDKGGQSTRGQDMVVLGDIATFYDSSPLTFDKRSNAISFKAKTNQKGELWVIIATDSTGKGATIVYFKQITILLSQSD